MSRFYAQFQEGKPACIAVTVVVCPLSGRSVRWLRQGAVLPRPSGPKVLCASPRCGVEPWRVVPCNAVQDGAVPCSAVRHSVARCHALQCHAVKRGAVRYGAVLDCAVQAASV